MTETTPLKRILTNAGIATAVTTAAVLALSKLETQHAAAGLNATSHIVWGDEAASVNEADLRHTLVGGVLNAGAMAAWAVVHELLPRARTARAAVAKGALVSLLAYVTDYYVVPKRLTPGFEKRLSSRSLWLIYGVLAGALCTGDLVAQSRRA